MEYVIKQLSLNLQALANTIYEADAFSPFEEKRILESLKKVSVSESARSSPTVGLILERVTDAFLAADRISAIAIVDEDYRDVLLNLDQQVPIICIAFAKGVVGGASIAGTEPRNDLYKVYCDKTANAGFPEVGLFWKILNQFNQAELKPNESVNHLIQQISILSDEDLRGFQKLLHTFSEPTMWQSEPTPQAEIIAVVIEQLLTSYPEI